MSQWIAVRHGSPGPNNGYTFRPLSLQPATCAAVLYHTATDGLTAFDLERLLLVEHVSVKSEVVIYHNPACGTSRNVLDFIRKAGIEPQVIEYLKTPPTREELKQLIARMGIGVRELLRQKGTPYLELGLDNPNLSDDVLLDAMLEHPILINRPIVITPRGVRLCRPSETVLALLGS